MRIRATTNTKNTVCIISVSDRYFVSIESKRKKFKKNSINDPRVFRNFYSNPCGKLSEKLATQTGIEYFGTRIFYSFSLDYKIYEYVGYSYYDGILFPSFIKNSRHGRMRFRLFVRKTLSVGSKKELQKRKGVQIWIYIQDFFTLARRNAIFKNVFIASLRTNNTIAKIRHFSPLLSLLPLFFEFKNSSQKYE